MAGPIKMDDRLEIKVSKLLPAEVTGLYVTVSGLISTGKSENIDKITWISIILIGILGLFYMVKTLKITNKTHLIVYTVSFFLWASTINSQTLEAQSVFGPYPDLQLWIAIAATLWTFTVPMLVTSEMVASQESDGTPIVSLPPKEVDDGVAPVEPVAGPVGVLPGAG